MHACIRLGIIVAAVLSLIGWSVAASSASAVQQDKASSRLASGDPNYPGASSHDNKAGTEVVQPLSEEVPEIEVEVVGQKEGEQPIPSLAPTIGEVITSINAAELEATGETNLADALEFLPGVTITHQGRRYETFVNVRASSSPVVLLDGALISSGIFAGRILYTLPFSAIERVDIIRSSSSLLYGPQALMGGVINIITKSGKGRINGDSKVYTQIGSYNYFNVGFAAGQGESDKGLFMVYDHDDADSNLKFGGRSMERGFVKVDYALRNGDPLKLTVMTVDGYRRFDVWDKKWQQFAKTQPAYWGIDPYQERVETLTYTHPLSSKYNSGIDALLWNRDQFYHNFSFGGPIKPKKGQTVFFDESGSISGGSLLLRLQAVKTHYVRIGVEYFTMDGYTQNHVLQADGSLQKQPRVPYWTSASGVSSSTGRLLSYVAQDEWSITPRTHFFYGARYQLPGSELHNTLTYATGLEHQLGPWTDLYAHFGNGVSYQSPADLASNPKLKNQTSLNLDIGIQRRFRSLRGRIGWFTSDVKNSTVSYLKDGGDPAKSGDYIKTQADYTKSGAELEVEGVLQRIRGLNYFFNYTYLHQEVNKLPRDGEGRPLQLAVPPKGQFSLGLRWSSPNSRTRLALSYTNVADQIARSGYYALAYSLDGYQYANLTAQVDLGHGWAINTALNNIFDETYQSQPGFPRPGRNYVIGISRTATYR